MGLRSIILIGISFLMLDLVAQTSDFQEEVHLSLSTTNILVGETLHFSAFVYSNKTKQLSNLSNVLYVELIDEAGKPIHQTKIGLRVGRGSGKIYINPAWLSNTYRMVAYTKWMRNYDAYFEQALLVLNPYSGLSKSYEIAGNPIRLETNNGQYETYGQLQQITMNLGDLAPATLSINVIKQSDLFYPNEINLENPAASIQTYEVLPDYKYAQVQGRIKDATKAQEGTRINMTVRGESFQVATTQTDEYGRFWMNYNPEIASENGAIQIQTENASVQVELISEFRGTYPQFNQGKTVLDSVFMSSLIERSIHAQIQNAYQGPKPTEQSTRSSYLNREDVIVYYLDEYKRFTSIRDTFIELTILVGTSKSEESDKIFVRCEQLPGLADNLSPLILLDGLRVDARTLLDHNPNAIEKIEVLPAYYFVNDQVYKGIISAHTFEGSGTSELGYVVPLSEYQPYSKKEYRPSTSKHLPQYETNVLWRPIHTHKEGALVFDFTTSRLDGNYQVFITGITNTGDPVNITRYFQVAASNQ